jgi:hypothetical protein
MLHKPKETIKRYLRNYDITQIKHQRMLHSFTIGRKLIYKENTDNKINNEIENSINGR